MPKIYAYSSNSIYCNYTLSISRSGSTITITASGTIYGNGSSSNSSNNLYAHVCHDVYPANTSGTTTYVSNYGTSLGGKLVVSAPLNKTSIPTSGKAFSVSWTINNNSAVTYNNCALFLSSSQNSASAAAGSAYMFIGKKDSDLNVANLRYYTQPLSVPAGYTNVSNPTASSIKFNSSSTTPLIVTPNGSITVSWTAGTAGTNNDIKQYEVTLNGTTKTTTTTSATFSNLNLGRGTSYKATVKSIPTVSGYGPDTGIQSTNQVKGNTLPGEPDITISQGTTTIDGTIYRKKVGNTTIRFTPSATDADGQTVTFRYATSSLTTPTTSNTTSFTSSTNFEPDVTTTYYFWSFDGLEFSESFTTTINIGTDISVTTPMTIDTNSSTITSYSNNGTTYYTGRKHTITTSGGVGTKTYKWYLQYNTTASATGATAILLGTTNTNSYKWAYPSNGDWNQRYRIYCVVTDALGSSGIAYGYVSGTTWFTIPAKPTFEPYIYNKWENNTASKIEHSYPNDFYETIVAKGVIDTSINNISYEIKESIEVGKQVENLVTQYKQNGYIPLKILQANTEKNTSYNLKITMKAAWGGSFEVEYKITRTGLPRIDSNGTRYSASNISTASPTSIKPFTESSVYNFLFLKGNMISNNNYATTSSSNTSLWLFYGEKEVRIANQGTWTTNSTTGYVTVPATRGGSLATAGLYNWNTDTLGLNLNGPNVVGLRIKFTDVFGQSYSIDKPNYLTINFTETPTINFSISNNSSSSTSGSVVKEGDIITYSVTGDIYNTTSATINAYIYENTTQTEPTKTVEGWKKIGTNTFTPSKTKINNKETYSQSITYTLGEISQSTYLYFRADIVQNPTKNETDVNNTYYISQRHTTISNFSVSLDFSENILKYTTNLSDQGAGRINEASSSVGLTSAKYGLQFSTDENFSNKQWLKLNGNNFELTGTESWLSNSISSSYTASKSFTYPEGISFYFVRPIYKTAIDAISKESIGTIIPFYNLVPTVSYRKNQIGINIDNVETNSTAAVVVGSTTGKNLIKLYSANNTATINLENGNLEGFKVNNNNIMSSNTSSRIFVQSSAPSSGMSTGDIWIDISNLT